MFQGHMYPTTRVIIDCTEIFTEMPTSYRSQSATFSSYKHHNTAKGLVGIAPSGAVTFVSDLYAGRSSDQKITKHCGILNLLENGDSLMANRGFDIKELCAIRFLQSFDLNLIGHFHYGWTIC